MMRTQQEDPLGMCDLLSTTVTLSRSLVPVALNCTGPAKLLQTCHIFTTATEQRMQVCADHAFAGREHRLQH